MQLALFLPNSGSMDGPGDSEKGSPGMEETQLVCPVCQSRHRQTKAGRTINGCQRYQCQDCKRYYCHESRRLRYPVDLRRKAMEMRTAGMPYRKIASELSVNHQTVANWIASASTEPDSRLGQAAVQRSPPASQKTPPALRSSLARPSRDVAGSIRVDSLLHLVRH